MKKVILSEKQNEKIQLSHCDIDGFVYGVKINAHKGIILGVDGHGLYRVFAPFTGYSVGDCWSKYDAPGFKLILSRLIEEGNNVYQFSNQKEFAKWLLED